MSFTERFTEHAGAYVVARPSYPVEAVDAILAGLGEPSSLVVADIGAGTGISSRALADRGVTVLAIEPNAAMRDAAEPSERVRWVDGTAEHTSLDDASVDVYVAFQAWHWVDHPASVAEARRVVRPGGRIALVYNERDESDPFTAGYGDIVVRFAQDATEERRANARAAFETIDPGRSSRSSFGNAQALDRAGVHKRAESSSYLPQSGDLAVELHAAIDDLLDRFEAESYQMQLATLVLMVDL